MTVTRAAEKVVTPKVAETKKSETAAPAKTAAAKAKSAKGANATPTKSSKKLATPAAPTGVSTETFEAEPGDYVLMGRILTQDDQRSVVEGGVLVSAKQNIIKAIVPSNYVAPDGVTVVASKSGQLIAPAFKEMHSHLEYNFEDVIPVAKEYGNRDQWPTGPLYEKTVSAPENLVTDPTFGAMGTSVRLWGEMQRLTQGTASAQGFPDDGGVNALFVRDVASPQPDIVPGDHIGQSVIGVAPTTKPADVAALLAKVKPLTGWFYHLSEGKRGDPGALKDFETLKKFGLIGPWLIGIHSAALEAEHFADWDKEVNPKGVEGEGPKVVWSPASNRMLYGTTTDIESALENHSKLAMGPDWTPSGNKGLLWEIKWAREYNKQMLKGRLTAQDFMDMLTRNPAEMLGWSEKLGQVKPGMVADLAVFDDPGGDPLEAVLESVEHNVRLVTVGGDPRYGDSDIMNQLKPDVDLEEVTELPGRPKSFDLMKPRLPDGVQTIPQIFAAIQNALKYDPTDIAQNVNTADPGNKTDPFHRRTSLVTWLNAQLQKDNLPPLDPTKEITPAQVEDFIKRKYPDAVNTLNAVSLFQENDPDFVNAMINNPNVRGDDGFDPTPVGEYLTKPSESASTSTKKKAA